MRLDFFVIGRSRFSLFLCRNTYFCETVSTYQPNDVDKRLLVVRATLVDTTLTSYEEQYTDLILTFKILESYYNPRSLSKVQIRSGNGADCGRSLHHYEIGDQLIFAVWIWIDTVATAQFSICSPPPLTVHLGRVKGRINRTEDHSIPLWRFTELFNCVTDPLHFEVFPNPAHEVLQIKKSGFRETHDIRDIQIHNAYGMLVYHRSPAIVEQDERIFAIDVSHWPAGLYTITVEESHRVHSTKVIVGR